MKGVFLLAIVSSLFLNSCLEDENEGPDQDRHDFLLEERVILKEDLEKAYLELDEYDVLFEDFEELKSKAQTVDEKVREAEELRRLREETEEKMRELRQEFEDYQKKYEAKVRREAFGEKLATVDLADRTLELVEIASVTETEVRLRHDSGFATLNHATAPAEWKARFFLRSKEEVAERARELALFLSPPPEVEGAERSEQSGRPVSDYQLSRGARAKQQEDLEALQGKVEKAFVYISGSGGKGTGFFVQDGITTFLYTAAHVLDGNSDLKIIDTSGSEWKKFGALEVARGLDLVRLAVDEPVEHFLTFPSAGYAPDLGIVLASLGFAEGGGVVSQQVGKLRKINSTSYESTSTFIKGGGSGWPVMNASGEVLAMLTEPVAVREAVWRRKTASRSSRFACRVDTRIAWEKASLGRFVGTQKVMDNFDDGTRILLSLVALAPSAQGLRLDASVGEGQTVMEVMKENGQVSLVKQLQELNRDLTQKKTGVSERDMKRRVRSIYATAQVNSDKQTLDSSLFSPYHVKQIEASLRFRSSARQAMANIIKNLSK